MNQYGYVVVSNKSEPIVVRHVIKLHAPYQNDEFAKWYYDQFAKLDGDEFTYCPTRLERDVLLDELSEKGA